jgi:DNA-binding transcriptional regulator YiaG
MPKRTYKSPTPEQIKAHRALLGFTQAQYAALLCTTAYQTVGAWERGEYPMHPGLWRLARTVGAQILRRRRARAVQRKAKDTSAEAKI